MAYINASSEVNRVKLVLIHASSVTVDGNGNYAPVEGDFILSAVNATGAMVADNDGILVPGLQDVTINNANGSFRWKQMDQSGENVITTNATNSLSGNFVLDPQTFWGTGGAGAAGDGIFKLSNNRIPVGFMVAPSGVSDGQTILMGTGYLSALAPTASADSPVWVSPITLEVNGDYFTAVTTIAA